MSPRLYRPLATSLAPIALIACMNSAPTIAEEGAAVPLGVDLGGSGPIAAYAPLAENPKHGGEMQMAHEGHNDAHGTGTVNSVDPTQHKVNMSHAPIAEIGWPAMTMEFPVAPSVDLKAIRPDIRVNFTIEQQPGGMYQIQSIAPAGGGR
jgi:Cu(I)/Ag(I) efflux system protein CusF